MKTFSGVKSVEQIKAQCAEHDLSIDTSKFDAGNDYVKFDFIHADTSMEVMFNGFNGRFFGTTDGGQKFTSNDANLDGTPWFDALLDFVYVSKQQAVAA